VTQIGKYATLVRILDRLRLEAPAEAKSYRPDPKDLDALDKARAKAFIHLFLKVRFGLLEFKERENFITDGPYDGGIDAYYIDSESKTLSIIQSKFRTNETNFEGKDISLKEILSIDADRIAEGHTDNDQGVKYNGKIQGMLQRIKDIPDPARYKWQVVLLANLKSVTTVELRKITGGLAATVFDFDRTYKDLVFPIVSGTFFNVADLLISLNLTNKELSQSRITYPVMAEGAACDITILFVPLLEVAKVLHRYKNSVLQFNPRNYLDLGSNPVNREIASTVTDKTSNEFALFNNGITVLSDETNLSERIGQKDKGQLHIKNPQIINGGQTAFTLCRIFERLMDSDERMSVFDGKEVMMKIITFPASQGNTDQKLRLIEAISKATNQQTTVSEADRRANDKVQIELQGDIFSTFGYFYERKRGEFLDGLQEAYISKDAVIDRETMLRVCCAVKKKASAARRQGGKKLFEKQPFEELLNSETDHREIFFGYLCYQRLGQIEKQFAKLSDNQFGVAEYGQGLRYGKYALVCVAARSHSHDTPPSSYQQKAREATDNVLSKWRDFESTVIQKPENNAYFMRTKDSTTGQDVIEVNFDGYYKGSTVDKDLEQFVFA
jgi:hypothetical protein